MSNVREWVEVVEWNRKRSPPFPCCPVSCQCLWKKALIEKKTTYFSCNGRWFKIFICNTHLQLFTTWGIITAVTAVVPFCFQSHLWGGFPSTKNVLQPFNTAILVSFTTVNICVFILIFVYIFVYFCILFLI